MKKEDKKTIDDNEIIAKAKELLKSEDKNDMVIELQDKIKTLEDLVEQQNKAIEEYRNINTRMYLKLSKQETKNNADIEQEDKEDKQHEEDKKEIDEIIKELNKPKEEKGDN